MKRTHPVSRFVLKLSLVAGLALLIGGVAASKGPGSETAGPQKAPLPKSADIQKQKMSAGPVKLHEKEKLGLSDASYKGLRAAVEKARYAIEPDSNSPAPPSDSNAAGIHTAYRANNHLQNLRTTFSPEEIRVAPAHAGPGWSLRIRLTAYGRGGDRKRVSDAEVHASGNRIEYRRGAITEWYVNDARGIEQGFTLHTRPEGGEKSAPVQLEMAILGNLTPRLLEDGEEGTEISFATQEGNAVLRYAKLSALDAEGRALPAEMRLVAAADAPEGQKQTIRLTVDDTDAVYPVTIDPILSADLQLLPTFGTSGDGLGFSVAIDAAGTTAVAGAAFADVTAIDTGAAFVFTAPAPGGPWTQAAKLTPAVRTTGDQFGFSVAIDAAGTTAVVGARLNDVAGADAGSAYVFVMPPAGWAAVGVPTETTLLLAADGAAGDRFGQSVGVSGGTVVVGSLLDDNAGGVDAGSAYVFVEPVSGWPAATFQTAKLTALTGAGSDQFGVSVDIDGATVVVAAFLDDDSAPDAGSAYVFVEPVGGWAGAGPVATPLNETVQLLATGATATDLFGFSIAVSAIGTVDTVAVGAPLHAGVVAGSGVAYVFVEPPVGGWAGPPGPLFQSAMLISSDGTAADLFGHSVAIDGATVVVGARDDDDACTPATPCDSGSAYVFVAPGSGWAGPPGPLFQSAKLTASDGAAGDAFGFVAVGGTTVIAGAPNDDDACTPGTSPCESGSAYIFSTAGAQLAKFAAIDTNPGDLLGISVAIDAAGTTAVVGAFHNDDMGVDAGSATVFVTPAPGGIWTQAAKLFALDATAGDVFGVSVAIDAAGTTVVVGAPGDDDAGASSGSAYVFSTATGGTQTAKLVALDASAGDQFGFSVALDGITAVIGAHFGNSSVVDSGSAYVFDVTTGAQLAELNALAPSAGDQFGFSVAIDSTDPFSIVPIDTVVVGARLDDNAGGIDAGAAYVFAMPPAGWAGILAETVKLTATTVTDPPAAGDRFGQSVAVDVGSGTVIVGAPQHDHLGLVDSGSAYEYFFTGLIAIPGIEFIAFDATSGDQFGVSVSLDGDACGDMAIISAFLDDDLGADSGSAYVFMRPGLAAVWMPQFQKLLVPAPPGGAPVDEFGFSVALRGKKIPLGRTRVPIVGVPLDDNAGGIDAGSAWTFAGIPGVTCPDVTGDGVVDIFDLLPIAFSFGASSPSPIYDPVVDCNDGDLAIAPPTTANANDLQDLVFIAMAMGVECPGP